ncbi:MAG: nuclear transport factor 2 family protein [Acidobacteria bacterium]|nr:nuclear transport factor 2 family protein [Acidobacteriota bacterium]
MTWNRVLFSVVTFIALVLCTSIPQGVNAADGAEKAIPAKFIAAWNSHDPAKMLAIFTDDVYYEDVAFGEISHGKAELSKFAASEYDGVPDLELKLVRASIDDGHGTIEWTFTGTDKAVYKTGKKFTVRGVSVVDVRGGKISRSLDYYDISTVMRQVGLLPAQ